MKQIEVWNNFMARVKAGINDFQTFSINIAKDKPYDMFKGLKRDLWRISPRIFG